MKYVINVLAVGFISQPAAIAGYIWAAVVSGWETGRFIYAKHEAASIKKFVKEQPHDPR